MKTTQTHIQVRYAETDQMGIAHHSCYAIWFEQARTEMIREAGIRYRDLEKMGLLLPLTGLSGSLMYCTCRPLLLANCSRVFRWSAGRRESTCSPFRILGDAGEEGCSMSGYSCRMSKPLTVSAPAWYTELGEVTGVCVSDVSWAALL